MNSKMLHQLFAIIPFKLCYQIQNTGLNVFAQISFTDV